MWWVRPWEGSIELNSWKCRVKLGGKIFRLFFFFFRKTVKSFVFLEDEGAQVSPLLLWAPFILYFQMTNHIWEAGQCPSSSLTSAFVGSVYFIFSNDHSHLRGGSMPNFSVALLPRECGAHYWCPSWGFVRETTGHVSGKRAISSLMVNLGYRVFLNWTRDGRFLKYLIFKDFYLTNIYWYHIYYQTLKNKILKFFFKKYLNI